MTSQGPWKSLLLVVAHMAQDGQGNLKPADRAVPELLTQLDPLLKSAQLDKNSHAIATIKLAMKMCAAPTLRAEWVELVDDILEQMQPRVAAAGISDSPTRAEFNKVCDDLARLNRECHEVIARYVVSHVTMSEINRMSEELTQLSKELGPLRNHRGGEHSPMPIPSPQPDYDHDIRRFISRRPSTPGTPILEARSEADFPPLGMSMPKSVTPESGIPEPQVQTAKLRSLVTPKVPANHQKEMSDLMRTLTEMHKKFGDERSGWNWPTIKRAVQNGHGAAMLADLKQIADRASYKTFLDNLKTVYGEAR